MHGPDLSESGIFKLPAVNIHVGDGSAYGRAVSCANAGDLEIDLENRQETPAAFVYSL